MFRYQATQPMQAETLRAIGKTNEEMAHEMALCWMGIGTDGDDMSVPKFYGYYDAAYRMFLEKLEARDEK